MAQELSDEDRAAIWRYRQTDLYCAQYDLCDKIAALAAKGGYSHSWTAHTSFAAGLAAGRARAIEECAKVCKQHYGGRNTTDFFDGDTLVGFVYDVDCAAAILALK